MLSCYHQSESRSQRWMLTFGWVAMWLIVTNLAGCSRLSLGTLPHLGLTDRFVASNDRDWKPEQAVVPYVESTGSFFTVRNVRDCSYVTTDDYVVNYHERSFDLADIQSVDFIVVPFKATSALAHTMLSFGFADGTYLSISVEVRKEKGEKYNPLAGLARKFELMYVAGEERDSIRVRTRHYDCEVYVYPTVATPAQAQRLFIDMAQRMNQLANQPEFYNSITNNCTTNLKDHVNRISPDRVSNGWQILLPGFSAKYAYEIGLLDNRIPFEDLQAIAFVNDLAEEYYDDPQFSQRIRSHRKSIDQYIERQAKREPTLSGRGDQYLRDNLRNGLRSR